MSWASIRGCLDKGSLLNNMKQPKDIIGKRRGRLTVIELAGRAKYGWEWLCLCDCGKTKKATTNALNSGHTRSCGCLFIESTKEKGRKLAHLRRKPPGVAAFNYAKHNYAKSARKRGLAFELSDEEFRNLTAGLCCYCGAAPSRIVKPTGLALSGNYICNGIDRIENSAGYILENCATCCSDCNYAKKSMTKDGFESWLRRASAFLSGKKLDKIDILKTVISNIELEMSESFNCPENAIALKKIQEAVVLLQNKNKNNANVAGEDDVQK